MKYMKNNDIFYKMFKFDKNIIQKGKFVAEFYSIDI